MRFEVLFCDAGDVALFPLGVAMSMGEAAPPIIPMGTPRGRLQKSDELARSRSGCSTVESKQAIGRPKIKERSAAAGVLAESLSGVVNRSTPVLIAGEWCKEGGVAEESRAPTDTGNDGAEEVAVVATSSDECLDNERSRTRAISEAV